MVTQEIKAAIKHVQSVFPQVCMVVFSKQARWCYMDEEFNTPKFDERIDIGILEAAIDSIEELPFVYEE